MQIHNFLCDLLVSVKLLLDTYLFPHLGTGYFASYQYNIGNRSFQLSKEPNVNYALPSVIVTINDEQTNFGGRRTDLIMRNAMDNMNKIPVLYNETQDLFVVVHEEQTSVSFSISINCESQLQAKEIAYTIKRSLPLNKNLNIFSFTSYLEIDHTLLLDILNFNIPFDTIQNLYTKLNYNTGKPEYCYSLEHNPLIRLDSVTTAIPDSSASTFQTQVELTYFIPFPQYLLVDQKNIIKTINFSFNVENHPIVTIPFTKLYAGDAPTYKIDRTLLIANEDTKFPDSVLISKTDTQVYLSIKFETDDFIIDNSKYKYRFYRNVAGVMTPIIQEPSYFYGDENKIVFVFSLDVYEESLKSNEYDPLFIDFYYDITVDS